MAAVTIQDVSKKARVAPSTVSLVLNGKNRVKPETREHVLKVIKQLGYVHRERRRHDTPMSEPLHFAMQYLSEPSSPRAKAPTLVQAYFQGVVEELQKNQCQISLIGIGQQFWEDPTLQTALEMKTWDGLILSSIDLSARKNTDFLSGLGIPVVAINKYPVRTEFSSVAADYYTGGRDAAAYLANHGHQKMVFAGLSRLHWPTRERYRGMRDELRARSLPAPHALIPLIQQEIMDHQEIVAFCLEKVKQGVTAVMVSDGSAPVVETALKQAGYRVPEDVSLVGCDGTGVTIGSRKLELTTLDFDKKSLGRLAVQILMESNRANSNVIHTTKTIKMTLVPGQTVSNV